MAKDEVPAEETVAEEPQLASTSTPPEAPKEKEEPKQEPPQPEPTPEEKPEEPEQLEEQPEEESPAEEEGEQEAPPKMSKRKAERLAKLENLVSKLRADEPPKAPEPKGMDYGSELSADDETIKRLEADRQAAAQSSFNEGLERAKSIQFHTRLEIDSPKVEKLYEELEVDAAMRNQLDRWYLTTVGYNPQNDTVVNNNLRYSDFVEGLVGVSETLSRRKTQVTQKNIAAQAANTGIRPDGSTTKLNLNKSPQDMTDDELNAVLARIKP